MGRIFSWILAYELGVGFKELVACVALVVLLGLPFGKLVMGKKVKLHLALRAREGVKNSVDPISTFSVVSDLYGISLATLAKAAIYKG